MESREPAEGQAPSVFVFNPFAEGFIARGGAFTPRLHQARLAEDLANLPQFLARRGDIVLSVKHPGSTFTQELQLCGFPAVEFVAIEQERLDVGDPALPRQLGRLQPWAWGPDSVKLLEPLFARIREPQRTAETYFNDRVARLYSKAWSAEFLRKALERARSAVSGTEDWLCPDRMAGVSVSTVEEALAVVDAIRSRGHHRVVVKEEYGVAGNNAMRLWEAEISPAQRRWLARALETGHELVVEPWLEREADFSVQLEMTSAGLKLQGYTGLLTDHRGQFLGNRAAPECAGCLPADVVALFSHIHDAGGELEKLYSEISCLFETELRSVGFTGPVSIDAFAYRSLAGECRLKPVVEINPRYTMGRLTLELMKRVSLGASGLFRLVTQAQARADGYADLATYARTMTEQHPLRMEHQPLPRIRSGAVCLNDPGQAQVCLATFVVTS